MCIFPTPGREFDTCLRTVKSSNQKCKFPSDKIFGGQKTVLGKNERMKRQNILYIAFVRKWFFKGTIPRAYCTCTKIVGSLPWPMYFSIGWALHGIVLP